MFDCCCVHPSGWLSDSHSHSHSRRAPDFGLQIT
jgi:hypothetical protein